MAAAIINLLTTASMNNKELGLLRHTDYIHQDDIKSNIRIGLEDIYVSLGDARESTRELEDTINEVLYGTGSGDRSEHRTLRQKLLDPKG